MSDYKIHKLREYLASSKTPDHLKQIVNYPGYNIINPNDYPTEIVYDQYDEDEDDDNGDNDNTNETQKSTGRRSNHEIQRNYSINSASTASPLAPGDDEPSAQYSTSIDPRTKIKSTRIFNGNQRVPRRGVTNSVSAYKHYFERLSTDSKMNAHDSAFKDKTSSTSDAVATYFEKHKIYRCRNHQVEKTKEKKGKDKPGKLSTYDDYDERDIDHMDLNEPVDTSAYSVPQPLHSMNDDEDSSSRFYLDADKFQLCISPEIFSPVSIPAIAYYSMEKIFNEAYILGGLVKMTNEEYYDYLLDLTENFTIPPENIKVIFDYELPLPLSSHLFTNLSVKLNDTVYKYSPSSNTLSILMKLMNSNSSSSINGSKPSVSSTSTSSTSSKSRYKDPPQLVSMSSCRISKHHIAMYGGFELVTDTFKYKDDNGQTQIELTKRIIPQDKLYVLDTLNISFKEIDITVPPSYSQVWAETISRFGQSLTSITIEENNRDSDTLNFGSDIDLQLSNSSASAPKSPNSSLGAYSRYTRPSVLYCFAGYKMVDSIATDGSGRIKHSFVALNDLWQAEVYLSKNTSSFEFGDEMIVFPTGKFDLIYSPFNHLFKKSTHDNDQEFFEIVNDIDSLEGYETFDPEYSTTKENNNSKEPIHRKFTGIYEYRDGDWPSPRAFFGFQMVDRNQLFEGYEEYPLTKKYTHNDTSSLKTSSTGNSSSSATNSPTMGNTGSTSDSVNLYHPQPYSASGSSGSFLNLNNRSPIQRKESPAMSSISNSLLQNRTSPLQKHKKSQFIQQQQQQQQYASLLSPGGGDDNNTPILPPSTNDSLYRRGSDSSVISSNHVFSSSAISSGADNTHIDINSTSNSSSGLINGSNSSVSRNLANKCLVVHGGSTKRYYKDIETGQTYYKNDILGDIWVYFIATETWIQLDSFSHPSIYETLDSRLFDKDDDEDEKLKSGKDDEKFKHIPRAVDTLTKPISFGICGHSTAIAGSNYFLVGGFHKGLFNDDMFLLRSVDYSNVITDDKITKFIDLIDKKSELFDEQDAPLDFHTLLKTQIDRQIIPRPYAKGMFVYRTHMLHLSRQTWKILDFFHPSIESLFSGEIKDVGYTPGVILFDDRMILLGGAFQVLDVSNTRGKETGMSDWIAECYSPGLTLSHT